MNRYKMWIQIYHNVKNNAKNGEKWGISWSYNGDMWIARTSEDSRKATFKYI